MAKTNKRFEEFENSVAAELDSFLDRVDLEFEGYPGYEDIAETLTEEEIEDGKDIDVLGVIIKKVLKAKLKELTA